MTRKIVYSIETLHHFSCECGKWFSIADWKQTDTLTCPSCGFRAEVEPMKQIIEPYDWGDINPDEIGEKIEWQ